MSIARQISRRFGRSTRARTRSAADYSITATISVVPDPLETRRSVVRHVNNTMTLAYWLIGRRLVVEEQKGGRRAAYGEHLLERISRELTAEFGRGFAEPQLRNCRLFYQAYPTESAIRYALRIKLSWTHHRAIKPEGDNPTIGILLGTEIDETELKYSIMSECKRLFATKLLPYLPTKEELAFEIERARRRRAK